MGDIQTALAQVKKIEYGTKSIFPAQKVFVPQTVSEALATPEFTGTKNSIEKVAKTVSTSVAKSPATSAISKALKPIAKKIPYISTAVIIKDEVVAKGAASMKAVVNPTPENLKAQADALLFPGAGAIVQEVADIISDPGAATEALVTVVGKPTKAATHLAQKKKRQSRPCPYDAGTASDGSKCGGRSAESRGPTAGYDTPADFFDQFKK